MSQRHTLAAEGPLGNAMPPPQMMPPSAMQKPPAGRLGRPSMLPQLAQRPSMMPGGPTLSRVSSQEALRKTSMRQSELGMSLMSGNRGDGGMYGRTSQATRPAQPSTIRRSSVYPSNSLRQSIAPGGMPMASRDPRPLRDRSFQAQCGNNLAEYLQASRFPIPITPKLLTSPTQKDFISTLKFLLRDFAGPSAWTKKFEDDALAILKDLKYPSMETIGKTALQSAGSQTNWIAVLPMLNWLVELNKAREVVLERAAHELWINPQVVADPLFLPAESLPLDHELLEERAWWDFSRKAYDKWYNYNEDEYPQEEAEYREIYDRLAEATLEEIDSLEREYAKRKAELAQLRAQEPPLRTLEEEHTRLISDQTKFIEFIEMHRQKLARNEAQCARTQQDIRDFENQIAGARAELARIEQAIAVQNLSPDEVSRMHHDRETLSRTLEDLRNKSAEAREKAYQVEMQVTSSQDRFEQLHEEYLKLAITIGLFEGHALRAEFPGLPDVDFRINLDLLGDDINEIATDGRVMRSQIWPALEKISEDLRKRTLTLEDERIALNHGTDSKAASLDSQREDARFREGTLHELQTKLEQAKQVIEEEIEHRSRANAELEETVSKMTMENQHGVLTLQTELENKKMEYQELQHKTSQLQENVSAEIGKHIDVIIQMKQHTASNLKSVKTFAESLSATTEV